jgi:hypothetical protein
VSVLECGRDNIEAKIERGYKVCVQECGKERDEDIEGG